MKYSIIILISLILLLFLLISLSEGAELNDLKHKEVGVLIWDASKTIGATYSVYLNGELLNDGIIDTQLNVGVNEGVFAVYAILSDVKSSRAVLVRPYSAQNVRIVTTTTTVKTTTEISK